MTRRRRGRQSARISLGDAVEQGAERSRIMPATAGHDAQRRLQCRQPVKWVRRDQKQIGSVACRDRAEARRLGPQHRDEGARSPGRGLEHLKSAQPRLLERGKISVQGEARHQAGNGWRIRARDDGHFNQLLQSEPTQALDGYDLSEDDRLALIQRDRGALEALGILADWADWFGVVH